MKTMTAPPRLARECVPATKPEVPSFEELHLQRILVPLDLSKPSRCALEYAAPLARLFHAKVDLLHVVEPPPFIPDMGYLPVPEDYPVNSITGEFRKLAERYFDPATLGDVMVRIGTPYETIAHICHEHRTDLVIITTHGYTGVKHAFMGSTAERVVRYAPCPVLVLRRREHEFV